DSLLFVNDRNPFFTMKIINLKSKEIINFGKKGRGPNEYQHPFSKLSINRQSNMLNTTNFPNYRTYSIDSIIKGRIEIPLSEIRIEHIDFSFLTSIRCDNLIIGSTMQNRFALYNITENKIFNKKFEYDEKAGALGSQGNFFCHPT